MSWLRLVESVHGHIGVLAAVALVHPALVLRRGKPLSSWATLAVVSSTCFTLGAFALGLLLYEDYRSTVRRPLFRESFATGLLFETKEHLAYMVVCLSLAACVCALVAPRDARALREAAAVFYVAAALGCLAAVLAGTWVSAVRGF